MRLEHLLSGEAELLLRDPLEFCGKPYNRRGRGKDRALRVLGGSGKAGESPGADREAESAVARAQGD